MVESYPLESFELISKEWRKIEVKQGTKIVRIKINTDKDEYYYGKLAISNEPRMNDSTEIFKLWTLKTLQGY